MDNRCPEAGVAASPPPRWRNPDHPPYAVMVQAALSALAKKEGSTDAFTEAAISRYIISAYPGIPQGHPKFLPYYLRKLVTAGELFVSPSGRYFLPDSHLCEPIAPPPPFPRPNALPSRKSSLVLRFRKTISDRDGSGEKDSWCYVGDGSTSSPSITEQQSGSVATKPGGESYPPVPALMQADPEKALLLPSPSLVSNSNIEALSLTLGELDQPKEPLVVRSPINKQQSRKRAWSKSRKVGGESGPPVPASMQAETEKTLLPPSPSMVPPSLSPVSDTNMEDISPALQLDELKELLPVSPCITDQQPGTEPVKHDVDSLAPVSIQALLEKARLSPPPSPVPGPNMECISPTLVLDKPESLVVLSPITGQQVGIENGGSLVALSPIIEQQLGSENGESQVLTPITEQQLGSENGELHPPVPASMKIEPEEVLLPPPPSSDLNLEFTSPILGLDKPKESSPISVPIAEQESENESRKRDGEAHLPTTVSIHTKLENPTLLPPLSDPNMEWASQVLALNELKESSLVSHPITNQQSGSDPGKQDWESYLLAPDSKQANSEEVLSLPLQPSPPVLGQLQTEPVPYLRKKISSPAPLNNEPNRERSSPALMLYELKESLPVSTPIANQQSGSESSKIDADSHPPNSALMQQTDPGKEPPPPPISVQSQAEPEQKLFSPDCVPDKPSLALGEKESLSKKRRPKHRKLWYEM